MFSFLVGVSFYKENTGKAKNNLILKPYFFPVTLSIFNSTSEYLQ